ncbi:MAG TPA: TolC family protein [Dissulfurispiraceae bacterium]|nr:TolC family protein [Dissulfurispiraceae bacterium]
MKGLLILLILILSICPGTVGAEQEKDAYTLAEAVETALRQNPGLIISQQDVSVETYGIDLASAARMPRLDFNSAVTRYRYPTPLWPISGSPLAGTRFPEFDNNTYDVGVAFSLPLYRGGRLDREVEIARMRRSIAEDRVVVTRQDLIFNVTVLCYRIMQLGEDLKSSDAAIRQLEAHRADAELFFRAGTAPKVDLLKAETGLAAERQRSLVIRNALESALELLKAFMGIDDARRKITLVATEAPGRHPPLEEALEKALSQRPDYGVVLKRLALAEERIRLARGRMLPSVLFSGEYLERAGDAFSFTENWNLALRLSVPVFDGGAVRAEVNREKAELEKVKEEARSLKIGIHREVMDAHLAIGNARERIDVADSEIGTARESLRIEVLKYESGAGTSTDVIDAQTALSRAQAGRSRAVYDRAVAIASLRRAVGDDPHREPEGKEPLSGERRGPPLYSAEALE